MKPSRRGRSEKIAEEPPARASKKRRVSPPRPLFLFLMVLPRRLPRNARRQQTQKQTTQPRNPRLPGKDRWIKGSVTRT